MGAVQYVHVLNIAKRNTKETFQRQQKDPEKPLNFLSCFWGRFIPKLTSQLASPQESIGQPPLSSLISFLQGIS